MNLLPWSRDSSNRLKNLIKQESAAVVAIGRLRLVPPLHFSNKAPVKDGSLQKAYIDKPLEVNPFRF